MAADGSRRGSQVSRRPMAAERQQAFPPSWASERMARLVQLQGSL